MNVIAGLIGGVLMGLIAMWVAGLTLMLQAGPFVGAIAFFLSVIIGIIIGIKAPNAGKAWRRTLLICAVLCFTLPLAGIAFTGQIANQMGASASAGTAAGVAIGGAMVSGFLGFVGFFLGLIFLVIGLLVGRDKTVVVIQQSTATAPTGSTTNP
jgi:hypothetical protein